MNNGGQDSLGLYATPFGDTTNYMAVLGGGSEEIAYAGFKNSFGLYWGSLDTYNSLTFYSGKVLVATITGADVDQPLSANGGQTDYASNGYVLIAGLPQFDRGVRVLIGQLLRIRQCRRRWDVWASFVGRSCPGALNVGHADAWLHGPRLCGFSAQQDADFGLRLSERRN